MNDAFPPGVRRVSRVLIPLCAAVNDDRTNRRKSQGFLALSRRRTIHGTHDQQVTKLCRAEQFVELFTLGITETDATRCASLKYGSRAARDVTWEGRLGETPFAFLIARTRTDPIHYLCRVKDSTQTHNSSTTWGFRARINHSRSPHRRRYAQEHQRQDLRRRDP